MDENKLIKQMQEKVVLNRDIKQFIIDNKISKEIYERDFTVFFTHYQNITKCNNCPSLGACQLDVRGYTSRLEFYNNYVQIVYFPCRYLQQDGLNNLEILYFPNADHLLNLKIDYENEARNRAIGEIMRFSEEYRQHKQSKGIFLHGGFGTGKTLLMLHLANQLAKTNVKILFAYYPELVRFLKSTIANNTLEFELDKLKFAPILILDDIGAENNTNFVRDEILGPLLQYRMMANLPTLMTSNYSPSLLRDHFSQSRDEVNIIKSDRIIERIRYMMEVVEIKGKNYRF